MLRFTFGTETLVVITLLAVRDLAGCTLAISGLEHAWFALCAGLGAGALKAAIRALFTLLILATGGDGPLVLTLGALVDVAGTVGALGDLAREALMCRGQDEPWLTGVAFDIRLAGGTRGRTSLALVQDLVLPESSSTGLLALAILKEVAVLTLGAACGQRSRGDHRTGLTVGSTGMALPVVEKLPGGLACGAASQLTGT